MTKFYSISIINKYAFILYLEKKDNLLIVLENFEIEVSQLSSFVKNKKNLHICVAQTFELSENVKVPITIAKSNNVKNYLFYKLKEANPNIDILFNFKKLSKQNDDEYITYTTEVVNEKAYLDSLSFVDNLSKIKSVTTNKFALLALANRCIDDDCYICVYTNGTTVLVLAVEQKEIIFSRTTNIDTANPQIFQMDMAENITQTLSYINNQFRDIEFKILALSGSIAIDDVIPQHIAMLSKLHISILYPNTFVRNIDAEESQTNILALGVSLITKSNQLLPKVILATRQFNIISTIFFVFSSLILVTMFYFTFNAYAKYTNSVNKNKVLQSRYLHLLSHTKMLSKKQLQRYTNHITLVKKYLQNTPADAALLLKPLIDLSQPVEFEYKNEKGVVSIQAVFEKHFKKLKNLYQFEKEFKKRFENINKTTKIEKKIIADYNKLTYKATIKTLKKNKHISNKRERKI